MAATTLTSLPALISAGDTLLLEQSLAQYPASEGWALSYSFCSDSGGEFRFDFSSTANGDKHLFSVDTSTWLPGFYKGAAYVTKDTERHQVCIARIQVLTNFATETGDTRSAARKILDYLDAAFAKVARRETVSATIEGISIQIKSMDEMIRARAYWAAIVESERRAEDSLNGNSNSGNILVRFN